MARVASQGLVTGVHGIFLTLTAPGDAVHYDRRGNQCRCTPDGGIDLREWNANGAKRWNRFLRDLSVLIGCDIVWTDDHGKRHRKQGLVYFRATEVQRRGALHYHVLIRRSDKRPIRVKKSDIRKLALRHGFGHSVDVQRMQPGHAQYVAKYVAKASDQRDDVPWPTSRIVRRVTERLDETTGELYKRAKMVRVMTVRATYRTWSASRAWGDSMKDVRLAQQHFVLTVSALPVWSDRAAAASWRALAIPLRPDCALPDADGILTV